MTTFTLEALEALASGDMGERAVLNRAAGRVKKGANPRTTRKTRATGEPTGRKATGRKADSVLPILERFQALSERVADLSDAERAEHSDLADRVARMRAWNAGQAYRAALDPDETLVRMVGGTKEQEVGYRMKREKVPGYVSTHSTSNEDYRPPQSVRGKRYYQDRAGEVCDDGIVAPTAPPVFPASTVTRHVAAVSWKSGTMRQYLANAMDQWVGEEEVSMVSCIAPHVPRYGIPVPATLLPSGYVAVPALPAPRPDRPAPGPDLPTAVTSAAAAVAPPAPDLPPAHPGRRRELPPARPLHGCGRCRPLVSEATARTAKPALLRRCTRHGTVKGILHLVKVGSMLPAVAHRILAN